MYRPAMNVLSVPTRLILETRTRVRHAKWAIFHKTRELQYARRVQSIHQRGETAVVLSAFVTWGTEGLKVARIACNVKAPSTIRGLNPFAPRVIRIVRRTPG